MLLALLAIVALAIFWLFLLKPSIETAASEAVASPLASLKDDVNEALGNAGLPTMPADGGGGEASPTPATPAPPTPTPAPGETAPPPTPTPNPTPDPGVVIPGLGAPIDGSLSKAAPTVTFPGTLFLTDFLFSNPNAQEGALVVLRNDVPLIRLRLENFRDYDVHFVTPIVIAAGDQLNLSLVCEAAGECDPAVLYSGYLRP